MPSLQNLTLRRLERSANIAIARIIEREPAEVGKGAMFRLYHLSSQNDGMSGMSELSSCWIGGNANREKTPKYSVFTVEKALRTAYNYQRYNHTSSQQSAVPRFHQYQGAALVHAKVPDINPEAESILIVSVSGLSAINDQRTGLLAIELMQWGAEHSIMHVLSTTQDRDYLRLRTSA